MKISDIIELLIVTKDTYRYEMSSEQVEAINYACNILEHNFGPRDDAQFIIDNGKFQ